MVVEALSNDGVGTTEAAICADPVTFALCAVAGGGVVLIKVESEALWNAFAGVEPGDEGEEELHEKEAAREACASDPTGQRGSPMDVPPGTNSEAEIDGLSYSGHALDEMQSEGFTPSLVQNIIQNGEKSAGESGRVAYYSPENNVTVIREDGRVVTVTSGTVNIR